MSSKENKQTVLQHHQSKKIPVDFGASMVTGMHVSCINALNKHYSLDKGPVKVIDPVQANTPVENMVAIINAIH